MEYKIIQSTSNYIYANIQLGLLREHGIDCHLKDENTVTIDPFLSPMIGGMKLMVADDQVPQAMALIEEAEKSWLRTISCPVCGKKALEKKVNSIHFASLWGRIRSRLINGSDTEVNTKYVCQSCGHSFADIPTGSDPEGQESQD